jgi:dolichol-phosphate mannosyltransferase
MKFKNLTVAILAKNEEATLAKVIKGVRRFSDDILLVDGHSKDKTREIARKLGARVVLDNGKGKGDGIRVAIREAKREIIIFIDADGSHDPNDIPRLVKPILVGKADHVSGSRATGGSDELYGDLGNFFRKSGNDIITLGINYRFNVRLTDSQNGFRAIKAKAARSLGLKEDITTIEQEMIIKTLRKGYKIVEIPTHEYKRLHGESKVKLRKVWFRFIYSWLKYLFF